MLKFIYRCFVPRCCHWVLPANQKCNFYFTLSALHCHLSIAILNNSFAIVFLSWGVHVASLVSSVIARLAIDLEYPQLFIISIVMYCIRVQCAVLVSLYVRIHSMMSIRCPNPNTRSVLSKWISGYVVITK